jgi:hypothetical protein
MRLISMRLFGGSLESRETRGSTGTIELTRARRQSQVHEPHDLQRKTAHKCVSTSFDFKAVSIGGPMMSTPPVDNFVMSWIY